MARRMMNCNEAVPLIAAYADDELEAPRRDAVVDHLRGCPGCASRHDAVLALRARLRDGAPRYHAPPGLRERIIDTLEANDRAAPAGARRRWLSIGALAGCTATIVAWLAVSMLIDWRANEDLGVAAVDVHVRATLGNHLMEVASSDQHTVKPWLSARLDYAPPVRDFAADGFALVGSRLDYLDRRPVATLVYRYRLHVIDVFVRPQSARAPPTVPRTVRGFNIAFASGQGMEWIAVSDASADVLASFVEKLARAQ